MIVGDEQAVYHVVSRTALDGFPIGDVERDFLLGEIKRFTSLYFCEIMGFSRGRIGCGTKRGILRIPP